jgi:hypothetical protein
VLNPIGSDHFGVVILNDEMLSRGVPGAQVDLLCQVEVRRRIRNKHRPRAEPFLQVGPKVVVVNHYDLDVGPGAFLPDAPDTHAQQVDLAAFMLDNAPG